MGLKKRTVDKIMSRQHFFHGYVWVSRVMDALVAKHATSLSHPWLPLQANSCTCLVFRKLLLVSKAQQTHTNHEPMIIVN